MAAVTPVLGIVADMAKKHRFFLNVFTIISIVFTIALAYVSNVTLALVFFAIANFGCQTASIFYNALMVNLTPKGRVGLVSGIGKMLGYGGAIIGLYLVGPIAAKQGNQAGFLPSGLLFLLFAIPCMLFVKDSKTGPEVNLSIFITKKRLFEVFRRFKEMVFNSRQFIGLTDFFYASFFGLCVVNVMILFMSVYIKKVFKLDSLELTNLIAFSTFFAIAGSLVSGYLSDRFGYKRSFICVFILWILCLVLGSFVHQKSLFWVTGALVGVSLGATWVVSRAMAIKLVPADKIGEVFGVFNLVGYFSCIAGVMFWGIITWFLSPLGELGYRIALFSLTGFLIFGLFFLCRIPAGVENR